MKNIKAVGKKLVDETKNLVLETTGGEMPDPDQKPKQTASDAAKVFEKKKERIIDEVNGQLVTEDQDEATPRLEKKAG